MTTFRCNYCKLTETGSKQLFPVGTVTPEFYILGDMVNPTEGQSGILFDTNTAPSNYLINMCNSVGITDQNSTFFKLVRCSYDVSHQVEDSCRQTCAIYSMMDIYKRKPKIILGLGTEVCKYLLGDRFKSITFNRGKLYEVLIKGEIFKVLPMFDPNYVINSKSMEVGETFLKDLKFAVAYVNGNLIDIADKDLRVATNYSEFKNYFDEKLNDCNRPAYDIETNAKDARSESARMVGFSLAPDGTTGIYTVRDSLEYKMPESDWNSIVELTKKYFDTSTLLVHNCMYEIPYTENEWDYLIENFEDTLVKSRLLLGGKIGAGLKDQAIRNLGYPDWDSDLGTYLGGIKGCRDGLKPTKTSTRWDYTVLKEEGFKGLLDRYNEELRRLNTEYQSARSEGKNPDPENYNLDKRSSSVYESMNSMIKVVSRYYTGHELDEILRLIGLEVLALVDSNHTGVPPYSSVPMRVISKYGAMDSVATQDLDVFLSDRMTKESKDLGIDLFKGYKYWKGHFTVASHMEMSGLYWNDDVANMEEKWYADTCMATAKSMMTSGFLDEYLIKNNRWRLNNYVRDEYLYLVKDILGPFQLMKSCIKLEDGTKITNKNILDALDRETGGQFSASKSSVILDLVKDEMDKAEHYTDLKDLFNPGSPKPENKQIINSILVSDDIRIAYFMNQLTTLIESPDYNPSKIPMPDRQLVQLIEEDINYNKRLEEYKELKASAESDSDAFEDISSKLEDLSEGIDEDESGNVTSVKVSLKDTFLKFKNLLIGGNLQLRSQDMQLMFGTALNFKLEDTKEPTLIELNSYYVIIGIDVENPETWSREYKFLYDFRMWKKCNKMITSYITGAKVGRGAVSVVDKKGYESGEVLTKRKRPYWSDTPFDPDKEVYVMQSSFKVCTAETGRWQTGLHTIPAGSAIKNFYTSRFENGIMAMPDYSAMEVRVIAGASGCEPMLKVFREGGDIHTNNAALIWGKKPEDITHEERRYSKMGTFALLYGADYRSFGMNFLDGDIAKAKQIFDNFFKAFPQIKQWVDKRHEEMRSTGKVTTMSSRYINISPDNFKGDENKALRASQNYPIQGSGSDMAGYVLYKIHEFIRQNNFKSKVVLFIHDSLEVDIHPDEFLAIGAQIIPLMNKFPMDEWNMVTSADLAIGPSLGQECEVKKLETDSNYNSGVMTIEAYDDCLSPLLEKFDNHFRIFECKDLEEPKDIYVPRGNLWIPKLAVNRNFGSYRKMRKVEVKISK